MTWPAATGNARLPPGPAVLVFGPLQRSASHLPNWNEPVNAPRTTRPCGRKQTRTSKPMLDNARSHGLWELTAPPAPETSGLKGSIRVDTAIVGGGYTGLSAALH